MSIRGTEGLAPADIQSEIARGARFVAYQWCISLLVVTLKRGTRVYYLKPGETGFGPGFWWSALSLVVGWWGIPWGPIYTLGSLWTNLRGGIDVTDAIAAELAAQHGAPAAAPLAGLPGSGSRWCAGPLAAVGVFAAAIATVVFGGAFYAQQHRPVALANGLDAAYTATIDGTPHALRPRSVMKIELPAGEHTVVATLPGGSGESRFTFTADDATVVNPDGAALVAEETTIYSAQSGDTGENPKPTLHAGRTAYSLREPDYFLTEFPESVSMSKHAKRATKRRVAVHADLTCERVAEILERYSGRPAALAYLKAEGARLPHDTQVLAAALEVLAPAEAEEFFAPHLATRPVLVEWHRAYQNSRRGGADEGDLAAEYRKLAEAEPDEGAFAYLYGRLLDNPAEDVSWFERALAAQRPCAYAHFALAYNAAMRGDFTDALTGLDRAKAAGLDNDTVRGQRIECLLALGRADEALSLLRERPARAADFDRLAEEFHLAYVAGGKAAATQVLDRFIAQLPAEARKESAVDLRTNFVARLAYYEGDPRTYGATIPADATGLAAVTRALCLGEHKTAVRAVLGKGTAAEQSAGYLFLYLSACREKSADEAEAFWHFLLDAWSRTDKRHARLADHFTGKARLGETELLDYPLSAAEKRLFLTALGLHEPKLRVAAFARAKLCNFSRDFPHHLVAEALATARP